MNTPAMRIKSTWFKPGAERKPEEHASAMAFIVFRVAVQLLKRMRGAEFDIDAGPPYFAFLRENLLFLVAVVDRMVAQRLDPEDRKGFTVALVRHLARTLEGNEEDLLGPPPAGEARYGDRFIDQVNAIVPHYADFGADPHAPPEGGFRPDFSFVRYFGHRLEPTLPEKDRRWVLEQVMAVEAPEAVDTVAKALKGLLDPTPRPARRTRMSGE